MAKKVKEIGLSDVQRLIHNKSHCMIKHSMSAYKSSYNKASTARLERGKKFVEDLSHVYATIPSITVPMSVEFESGTQKVELRLNAKIYRYKSYKELLAIYHCCNMKEQAGEVESIQFPGILGDPNYDEDGFCIVFGGMAGHVNYRCHDCGFGAFSYSPDGAEAYMRSYFIAHAIETRNRTYQRKFGYQAMTWKLAPSAKTLLKIFFRKNEKPECESSLPVAEPLPTSAIISSEPPSSPPESSSPSAA